METLPIPLESAQAFGLFLARTGALVAAAPVLGLGTGFGGYKVALVFCLSLVLFLALGAPLVPPVDGVTYALLTLRELLIGVFLGLLLDVLVFAVRVSGEMIGHEMGFLVARQVDPVTGVQSSLITSVYENLFLLAVLVLNGHHLLVRALDSSFARAPVGRLTLGAGTAETFQAMFAEMFAAGIVFAAPVLVFLVVVSVLIGILARAVPTLNVLELGFTVRVIVALAAMFVFAPLLEPSMTRLNERFLLWLERGLTAIGG